MSYKMYSQNSLQSIRAKIDEYDKLIYSIESELASHKMERERFIKSLGIQDDDSLSTTKKKEKIQKLWEPTESDLLPDDIEECHELIITLRKVIRQHIDN